MSIEDLLAQKAAQEAQEQQAAQTEQTKRLLGESAARGLGFTISEARSLFFQEAIELGVDYPTLAKIAEAKRISNGETITLPQCRYAHLSRGTSWIGAGHSGPVSFLRSHSVGPGKYRVGGSDGFKRKETLKWTVEAIKVGPKTWTIAN